jgi:zinc protease
MAEDSHRMSNRKITSSLPGPHDVLRRSLPNGITVLARENFSAPSVVVDGYLEVGNLDEPEDLAGLASFTSAMLGRGTRKRSFADINELVESVGASLGFSAERRITGFSAKCLAEDLNLILDVLTDELREPVFPAEYVERLRGMRLTAIAERENDTRQMAGLAFRELMYGNHPLGRDLLGSRQSNEALRRDDLVSFYESCYCPRGMVIAVVGAISAEDAFHRVADSLGAWSGDRPALPVVSPVSHPDEYLERRVLMPHKSQADLIVGWPAMRRLDPDFDGARMANTVLGVFGMMGRLGENVREAHGMAYYAYSRLSANRDPGTWAAIAGVAPENVERAFRAILVEVERLRQEPVPADELQDCKRYLTGSLPIQLETNEGVAGVLVDIEWHGLGLDYVQRYKSIIDSITPSDVQAAAQKYLNPAAYALAIAGP